jgi:ABC-type multidrug transport system fused ATPase/permease subunit
MAATAITATSNTLQIGISERLGVMLQSTSTVCAAVVVAFIWSWNITLITSSLLTYVLIVLSICAPPIVKGMMNVTKKDSEAIATASEAIEGVRLVTACGAQSLVSSRYAACVNEALRLIRPITPIIAGQLGLVVSMKVFSIQMIGTNSNYSILVSLVDSVWLSGTVRNASQPVQSIILGSFLSL